MDRKLRSRDYRKILSKGKDEEEILMAATALLELSKCLEQKIDTKKSATVRRRAQVASRKKKATSDDTPYL